jgi:hypothetical protein
MRRLYCLAASLLTGASVAVSAQGARSEPSALAASTPAPASAPLSARPVVATAVGDAANRVGSVMYFTITLRNVSDRAQKVRNLTVAVDDSPDNQALGSSCALSGIGEPVLPAGETYSQTCRFPALATEPTGLPTDASEESRGAAARAQRAESQVAGGDRRWFSWLFSSDVRLLVDVDVQGVGSRQFFPVITVKSNEASIFIGGIAGAMLLALFVATERLLRSPKLREEWRTTAVVTLVMGLRGGLLAVVALLLGKTTQGIGSPVTISVSDFQGGVLIGLFSYPLATWISSTLKVDGVFVPQPVEKSSAK